MNREQLEAAIWRHWPPIAGAGPTQATRIDAILEAADQYAAYVGGITAERRAVLAAAEAGDEAPFRKRRPAGGGRHLAAASAQAGNRRRPRA